VTVVERIGRELYDAHAALRTIAPLGRRHPELAVADAYRIQAELSRVRESETGAKRIGMKIGCTSEAIRDYFGIDRPDFGVVFDDMLLRPGSTLDLETLIQPRMEAELAFRLTRDLAGPGVAVVDVLAATEAVAPCMEIIDSRIENWEISIVDTIADNGSSAQAMLGAWVEIDRLPSLDRVEVVFTRNGSVVGRGLGSDVLGHPANAVAWLANTLGEFGDSLRAGEIVLSGAFTTASECAGGDVFEAEFDGIGGLTLVVA
jgi:2-oxopent-4-enoate/cis-2-oxohex-4-enoate hydratase